jgi:hypothetical protein
MERAHIDRTYRCRRRDGAVVEVNVFDFNIAIAAGSDRHVQLADGSWMRPSYLTVIREQEKIAVPQDAG